MGGFAHVEVESFCLAMMKLVPVSGFRSRVMKASAPWSVTPGIVTFVSPIQSVFLNSGEDRKKRPWRFISSYFEVSFRDSRIAPP